MHSQLPRFLVFVLSRLKGSSQCFAVSFWHWSALNSVVSAIRACSGCRFICDNECYAVGNWATNGTVLSWNCHKTAVHTVLISTYCSTCSTSLCASGFSSVSCGWRQYVWYYQLSMLSKSIHPHSVSWSRVQSWMPPEGGMYDADNWSSSEMQRTIRLHPRSRPSQLFTYWWAMSPTWKEKH